MTLIPITLTVNGQVHERRVEPRRLLVDFLREELGLSGTHVGCEHGVCGACTVLLDGASVRACLIFAVQADGADIRTVEALSQGGQLHPLQEAFREHHGLQCGFCTPGFLMTACELFEEGQELTEQEIRVALAGHLCRCTGYQGVVESVRAALTAARPPSPTG